MYIERNIHLKMLFENEFVKCEIKTIDNCQNIHITGIIFNRQNYKNVVFVANNPIDKKASYSGTGLPFPCAEIAFEGTNNIKMVDTEGNIDIKFSYPNSYYSVANKKKVISSVFLIIEMANGTKEFIRLQLEDLYPLRTLINRETRNGPEFYSSKYEILPVDTAEEVSRVYSQIKKNYMIA
jgi:hypothetical protein